MNGVDEGHKQLRKQYGKEKGDIQFYLGCLASGNFAIGKIEELRILKNSEEKNK